MALLASNQLNGASKSPFSSGHVFAEKFHAHQ